LTQYYPHKKIETFSQQFTPEAIQLLYQIALMGKHDLPLAPSLKLGFEMVLLRLLTFEPVQKKIPIKSTDQIDQKEVLTENKKEKPTETKNIDIKNWANLLTQLKLTGITQTLTQHCEIKSFEEDILYLELDPRQKPLLQPRYIDRIKTALKEHYQRPVHVKISAASKPLTNTPNAQAERLSAQKHQAAEKNLSQDSTLKALAKSFDAQILKGTIEPCET